MLVAVALALALALFVVRERAIAGAPGFPLDDSWIHLHFARNLAEGTGFSYNPGVPVAGSTAPLWTLLLGLGAAVAGAGPAMAKTLGVALTLAAAVLLRRAMIAGGVARTTALVTAVALVWSGPVVWGALSGMEVSLALALTAGALLAHAAARTRTTAVLAALAVLARPEAILLVPLLMLARPVGARRVATFALITAAVLAPAVAFSMVTIGSPLPATAAAKVEGGLLAWLAGVREPLVQTLVARPWAFLLGWMTWLWATHPLLPLAIPAVAVAWWRGGRVIGIPALVLVLHPLALALGAAYREPGFQEGRYSIHLLPLALLTLAVAMPRGGPLRRGGLLLWLALALLVLPRSADRYAWSVQNITAMQVHLGRWLDRHVPASARLAVNDIGAIAFFSRRPIVDLMGLVTPEIIPYRRQGEVGVIRYIRETCPDYLVVFPTWFPELTRRADLVTPVYGVRLERNVVSGGPEMIVYRLVGCTL